LDRLVPRRAASSVIGAVKPEPTSVSAGLAAGPTDPALPVTELLILCTGNASRSVMAGFMLDQLKLGRPHETLHIVTAGTLTIDGQPMGLRTRTALSGIPELADTAFGRHRSRQVHGPDLERAALVVVMEADHVRFVRRQFPEAAGRTATIRRLCDDLGPPPPLLPQRVAALDLADAMFLDEDDVIDPAGGDEAQYAACAAELWSLCQTLIKLL
jgi:protein-tyrosine-phosphatase